MPPVLPADGWVTLGLSIVGCVWLALIVTGVFDYMLKWLYARYKGHQLPNYYIPEDWNTSP